MFSRKSSQPHWSVHQFVYDPFRIRSEPNHLMQTETGPCCAWQAFQVPCCCHVAAAALKRTLQGLHCLICITRHQYMQQTACRTSRSLVLLPAGPSCSAAALKVELQACEVRLAHLLLRGWCIGALYKAALQLTNVLTLQILIAGLCDGELLSSRGCRPGDAHKLLRMQASDRNRFRLHPDPLPVHVTNPQNQVCRCKCQESSRHLLAALHLAQPSTTNTTRSSAHHTNHPSAQTSATFQFNK